MKLHRTGHVRRLSYPLPSRRSGSAAMSTDYFAKLLTFASVTLLLASLAYDWTYLYTLNLSFNSLPTTIADHARSALIWTGPVVLAFSYALIVERMGNRKERKIVNYVIHHRLLEGLALLSAVMALTNITGKQSAVGAVVLLITFVYLRFTLPFEYIAWLKPLSKREQLAIWSTSFLILITAFRGASDAWDDTQPRFQTPIVLKDDSGSSTHILRGFRRFTNSAIIVFSDGKVLVVPNERIVSIGATLPDPSFKIENINPSADAAALWDRIKMYYREWQKRE